MVTTDQDRMQQPMRSSAGRWAATALFFATFSFAAPGATPREEASVLTIQASDIAESPLLLQGWLYKPGDDAAWAQSDLDDSAWERLESSDLTEDPAVGWSGIGFPY